MKHFIIVLSVALLTLALMFAIYNPELLKDTWLWIVGLIGPIVAFVKELVRKAQNMYENVETKISEKIND
jgi:hypothetical protein